MRRAAAFRRVRGLTLVEIAVVLAVVGIIATMAWPAHLAELQRARRLDATSALTRLQFAQERHRSAQGRYAADLAELGPAAMLRSAEGLYDLSARSAGDGAVLLLARARADRAQHDDANCREITLQLNQGLADPGPNGRCWNQ
jgi:type IV pilus assembly protein PilE